MINLIYSLNSNLITLRKIKIFLIVIFSDFDLILYFNIFLYLCVTLVYINKDMLMMIYNFIQTRLKKKNFKKIFLFLPLNLKKIIYLYITPLKT